MPVFSELARKSTFVVLIVLTAVAGALPAKAQAQGAGQLPPELISYADQIYINGKIITVDKDFSVREAIAVRDGKILAVGTTAAIQRYAGPKTQRVDLAGKTMIPGIVDSHVHLQSELPEDEEFVKSKEPKLRDYENAAKIPGGTYEEMLASIKQVVDGRKPGTWVRATIAEAQFAKLFSDKVKVADLDRVAPNNPLVVGALQSRINTKVMDEFRKKFGTVSEEIMETGSLDTIDGRSVVGDLLIEHPMESLYEPFKKHMKWYAKFGVTTWGSSLTPLSFINIYHEMDRRGEMPIRFGFSHSVGVTDYPEAWRFYQRLGDLSGLGTDMLWITGSGIVVADLTPTTGCISLAKETSRCPLARKDAERRRALFEMVKNGQRITSTHVSGDGSADSMMDIIEEASAAAGFTPEQVKAKMHTMDHCGMYPRPDQIPRANKLGIMFSCGGDRIDNGVPEMLTERFGEEYAHKWPSPVASIIKSGGKVAGHGEGVEGESYFVNASMLVTRTNSKGKVWGKAEAVDRRTMLRMYTINGAEYMLRADRIGSIEVGKFADLAVLDKDFLAVPDDQLKTIKALLTVVGGKVVWQDPSFQMTK